MARARNIKPGFFRNADLVELPMEARLLFIGLWTLADRLGRLEDRPKQIKMEIFPADNIDCDAMLTLIAATGMLARYEIDGKRYLQVENFCKHQNPHKDEKASTIPDQCGHIATPEATLKKHSASTVQTPCKPDSDTVAILLNPESLSLIADSLNPESKTRAAASETVLAQQGPARAFPDEQIFDELGDIPGNPGETPEVIAPHAPSMAAAVCIAIKAAGIAAVNPSHPELTALLDNGADIGMFVYAAHDAAKKGKGFNYLLAAVKGQMADAKNIAGRAGVAVTAPNKQEALEASNRAVLEKFLAKDLHAT